MPHQIVMLANCEDFFQLFKRFLPSHLKDNVVLVRDDRTVTPFRQSDFPEISGRKLVRRCGFSLGWLNSYPLTLKLLYPWLLESFGLALATDKPVLFLDDDCIILKDLTEFYDHHLPRFAAANEGRLGQQKNFSEHQEFRDLFGRGIRFTMEEYNQHRLNSGTLLLPKFSPSEMENFATALKALSTNAFFSSSTGWRRFFVEQKFWNYFLKICTSYEVFPRKAVLFDNSAWPSDRKSLSAPCVFHYAYGENDISACVNWLQRAVLENDKLVVSNLESPIVPVQKFRHAQPEQRRRLF